jgi:hypothetical protein
LGSFDKGSFLDKLKKNDDDEGGNNYDVDIDMETSNGDNKKPQPKWNVLRDDFVMGGKVKNWDKNSNNNSDDGSD